MESYGNPWNPLIIAWIPLVIAWDLIRMLWKPVDSYVIHSYLHGILWNPVEFINNRMKSIEALCNPLIVAWKPVESFVIP